MVVCNGREVGKLKIVHMRRKTLFDLLFDKVVHHCIRLTQNPEGAKGTIAARNGLTTLIQPTTASSFYTKFRRQILPE